MNTKTIIFAYHDIGTIGIQSLLDSGYKIDCVFTHQDDPSENHFFQSVSELCARNNITVFAPENINTPLWISEIKNKKPDYIFSFYYRNILSSEIIESAQIGAFNLHGSLLPQYRGRAPLNWVLLNGESETGVTLHRMTKKVDAGNIITQIKIKIDEQDNALTLHNKIKNTADFLMKDIAPKILTNNINEIVQDQSKSSYFGKRSPKDGQINWSKNAKDIYNLIRATTKPYPGAFSYINQKKLIIWESQYIESIHTRNNPAGTILSKNPLQISCGNGSIEIKYGQIGESGLFLSGEQISKSLGLVPGNTLNQNIQQQPTNKKILILGVNGFIGYHLSKNLLTHAGYEIFGMDIASDAIESLNSFSNFHFVEGDISIHSEWIEYHIKKCDIILPLVAIATPMEYTRNPLRVFELDFEENLKIIRYCFKYNKRVIFPSTSEVYGMCQDNNFNEDTSNLIVGPINKQRWIYSVSKQLLDRVIWAYGTKGLNFTLFRPFNWMGPRLDRLNSARIGSSRAITQLILNLVEGTPIQLVDGGLQKRCFTDVDDGIDALIKIIDNHQDNCNNQIINIGNPSNEASIEELALKLVYYFEKHPLRDKFPLFAGFKNVESKDSKCDDICFGVHTSWILFATLSRTLNPYSTYLEIWKHIFVSDHAPQIVKLPN